MEQIVPIASNIETAMSRFNPAQREAVVNTAGPMLVIAGAGSGKTSVLTTRIALLMSQGVLPERILALTFTKKAAEEMRQRIISIQGDDARRITMGTFHSVFVRFLREYAYLLNFPSNFTILDEDDSDSCLKRCMAAVLNEHRPPKEEWTEEQKKRYAEEDKGYKLKTVRSIISLCKNELITADEYCADRYQAAKDATAGRPQMGRIFREYRDQCYRMGMMDFDDLLLYTDILMENNPSVLAQIAGRYDYILVDEYQDTNVAQYSILRRLTWINKNICVVGDDSQSIYAFRGARVQNIINFEKEYSGCRVVKLEQNYRSTKNIVNAANKLIAHNEGRIPKTCFSEAPQGGAINVKACHDDRGEAAYIAALIRGKVREKKKKYSDFAVLYRTNAQSRAIEDALVKNRIPYTVYSGTSFFSRMEVKDMMAFFRLAVNPNDDEAFIRIVKMKNIPRELGISGVGDKALVQLEALSRSWDCSLWQAVTHPQFPISGLPSRAMTGLGMLRELMEPCIEEARTLGAYAAASNISRRTGLYEYYQMDDEDSLKRADNIRELVDSVKAYEDECSENQDTEGLQNSLAGWIQNVMLLTNADTGEEGDKVSLMTVHCAKGLEFDTVIIAGFEKKLFPLEIDGSSFEVEEERRLCYVALTRAKNEILMTHAERRVHFGKWTDCEISPFFKELSGKRNNIT